MPMSRSAFLTLAAASSVGGRASAASGLLSQASGQLAAVRLGTIPTDDVTPIVYAQKTGLFTRAGLDVEITKMGSGSAVTAGVVAGAFDIGKSSLTSLFEAYERGLPISLLAASTVYDSKAPYSGFIVAKDGPVHTGADLDNQLVSVAAIGDVGSLGIENWVDKTGGDAKTIKFVEIPSAASLAAIEQNRVAAAEANDPHYAAAIASGKARALTVFDALAPTFVLAAWFTTRDYSGRNPEIVRAWGRVFAQAAAYTNAHSSETAPMMAEFTGIPLDVIEHSVRSISGIVLRIAQIQPVLDAAVRYGQLKRAFPVREMFDPNAVMS